MGEGGVGGSLSSFSKFEPVNIIPIQTIGCKIGYISILKKNVWQEALRPRNEMVSVGREDRGIFESDLGDSWVAQSVKLSTLDLSSGRVEN